MGSTETDKIWEDYVKPRHPVTVEDDNTCDDEVDYSEENALYCGIPNHYSDVEYHQIFCQILNFRKNSLFSQNFRLSSHTA